MRKLLIIIGTILLLSGCKTTKYIEVPVEVVKVKTEYVYQSRVDSTYSKDSIYIHDSIYVKEKGDSVFVYKYNTKYIQGIDFKYIYNTDTVLVCDSIPVITPVKEVVEVNKLNWIQELLIWLGIIFLIYVAGKIYFIIKK